MKNTISITEYDSLICGKNIAGYTTIKEKTFEDLENFILSNRTRETDALELMSLSAKRGIGKVITAKNYVGIISMNDGTTIEILPKIYSKQQEDKGIVKKILIEMLKSLRNSPYKTLQTSNVAVEKMNIFEIFIRMFIDEVMFIVKRGLKCDYKPVADNENVFKGKIIFSENIRHNLLHKERVFVEFDEFNSDRPENRLIKSTLFYLYKNTISTKNKSDLLSLLNAFQNVPFSQNYAGDFAKVVDNRSMKDYKTALLWCKVFLLGKTFTSFAGSEVAIALLFPMNELFESYIALKVKRVLNPSEFKVSAQDKRYHLFDNPSKFLIKPDIVIEKNEESAIYICDTKWKILDIAQPNYGISQSDMYQMYAYQKKYNAKKVILIYPQTNKVKEENISYSSFDNIKIEIKFVDLYNIDESINNLSKSFE